MTDTSWLSTGVLPDDSNGVEYRHIPGYAGYCVGSDGTVWSKFLRGYGTIGSTWRKLKPARGNAVGYLKVSLGAGNQYYVHDLVLQSFVGPRPVGMDACHCDGNTLNNRLENLRWDSRTGNMADAVRHGRVHKGSSHWNARFTEEAVSAIRRDRSSGVRLAELAQKHGVSEATICRIAKGQCYRA